MANVIILLIIIIAAVYFFKCTKFGKRLGLRASGTADEIMNQDATTVEGATAFYNVSIEKKRKEYSDASTRYAQITGQIADFEKQLRDLQKEDMKLNIDINSCIDTGNDDGARLKLKLQQSNKEKVDILKSSLNDLKDNEKLQKEIVDRLKEEYDNLKAEKDKQIFTLETIKSTESLKADKALSNDEEDQMLEKVRDGIRKKKQVADGNRIAYENSAEVQQQRIDKQLKEAEIDTQLAALKAKRGK